MLQYLNECFLIVCITLCFITTASPPVRQLSATTLNYSHVNLSWNKPSSINDYITSYFVKLQSSLADDVKNFTVHAPNTSLLVEVLIGNTQYTFDVTAITVFNGNRLDSNVTSVSITTPTGSEFSIFVFINVTQLLL